MAELWDVLDINRNPIGKLHERGQPLGPGEYHLVIFVWIVNDRGEFLISKRSPNKPAPLLWENTGGAAVTGDDSLTTALKEVREELGIILLPENGELYTSFRTDFPQGGGDFCDVWLFRQNCDLADVVLQPDETCDAMLATKEQILQMMEDGTFLPKSTYPYLDDFFAMF